MHHTLANFVNSYREKITEDHTLTDFQVIPNPNTTDMCFIA